MAEWVLSDKSKECPVCKKYGRRPFDYHDLTMFAVGIESDQYRERMERLLENDSNISHEEAFRRVVFEVANS